MKTRQSHAFSITRALHRRKTMILGITVFGTALSVFALKMLPPLYIAHAQIAIDHADQSILLTHAQTLKSAEFIQSALNRKKAKTLSEPIESAEMQSRFKSLSIEETELSKRSHALITKSLEPVIESIQKNLDIKPIPGTTILSMRFTDPNPSYSAEILNALIAYDVEEQPTQNRSSADKKTREFLLVLEQNIHDARTALEQFKIAAASIVNRGDTIDTIRLNEAYFATKENFEDVKVKLAPFMRDADTLEINPKAPILIASQAIQDLQKQERDLSRQKNALSARYGPKHPKMKELSSGITLIEKQIEQESINIITALKTEYDLLAARLKSLEQQRKASGLEEESATRRQITEEKIALLQARLDEAQSLYDTFKQVANKAQLRETGHGLARILSQATIPEKPSLPNMPVGITLSALLFFTAGIMFALILERKRAGFISARQIEEELELPCFSLIPEAKADKTQPIAQYVLDNPASIISEAVRTLRLNIKLREQAIQTETKVITITSSLAGEGKTTLSAWLGLISAQSGERVILIDADLRRPSIGKAFGTKSPFALVDYLTGRQKLENIIDTSSRTGLHIIHGRSVTNSALDLIASEKMSALIQSLRESYDLIIIDTPACMAVPDARALEKRSDLFLYCIAWGKTKNEVVHSGITQFRKFSKPSIATVLTQIDLKKHVSLGYGQATQAYEDYQN